MVSKVAFVGVELGVESIAIFEGNLGCPFAIELELFGAPFRTCQDRLEFALARKRVLS